MDSKV